MKKLFIIAGLLLVTILIGLSCFKFYTQKAIGAVPSSNGMYGIYNATPTSMLRDGYGSALATDSAGRVLLSPSSTASLTGLIWTSATGTNTTSTNMYATTYRGGSYYGDGYFFNTNGTGDIGSALNSANNIFSSGTYNGVNAIYTGTVTQGTLQTQPDAGSVPVALSNTNGTVTTTRQAIAFGFTSFTDAFSLSCFTDGAGTCLSTTTVAILRVPFAFPVSATTTMTTSTILDAGTNRHAIIGYNSVTSTFPTQLFTSSTSATTSTFSGTEIETVGTSSTASVKISDAWTVDVFTNGLTCDITKMASVTWRWSPMFTKWYIYAMSPFACK